MLKMMEICYVRYSHKVILFVFKYNNFIQFRAIKKRRDSATLQLISDKALF